MTSRQSPSPSAPHAPSAPHSDAPAAIQLIDISKRFGAVLANDAINLTIAKGSIHGIIGENGAGKSTLMSILYGFYQADSGTIAIHGKTVKIQDSQKAIRCGIGMVHQHFMLVDTFTVLENVVLGAEDGPLLGASLDRARAELAALARDYALDIDPDMLVGDLSVGLQQRVEILKALFRKADILILDEPTGVLTPAEADHLFRILEKLRAEGKTVLLITHKLREIMAITDHVSVMRRGAMVASLATAETSMTALADLMVGRHVQLTVEKQAAQPGAVLLDVVNLSVVDHRGVKLLDDVSFQIRAGEIVGLAGVSGNGQSVLLDVLSGMRAPTSGEIRYQGTIVSRDNPLNAADMRALGLAHVPEDRLRTGLVKQFRAEENYILGYQSSPDYQSGRLLDLKAVRQATEAAMKRFDVRPQDPALKSANFSGGNQQKLILAREIDRDPAILLVGQPTRGVDIGAIEFIHKRLIAMREEGKAILLVSVELDEIRALSDRILVMFAGTLVGERAPEASEGELGLMMAGIKEEAKA